jgi:hypothetical protein
MSEKVFRAEVRHHVEGTERIQRFVSGERYAVIAPSRAEARRIVEKYACDAHRRRRYVAERRGEQFNAKPPTVTVGQGQDLQGETRLICLG